jgi:hypothetical protein
MGPATNFSFLFHGNYLEAVAGFLMWGALSDEKMDL